MTIGNRKIWRLNKLAKNESEINVIKEYQNGNEIWISESSHSSCSVCGGKDKPLLFMNSSSGKGIALSICEKCIDIQFTKYQLMNTLNDPNLTLTTGGSIPISKFRVECYDYNKNEDVVVDILDAFVLANISIPPKPGAYDYAGLNMCIVCEIGSDANKSIGSFFWREEYLSGEEDKITVYLLGNKGEKIPVEISEGRTGKEETRDFGYGVKTSCYFGYINPLMFDTLQGGKHWIKKN